MPRILVFCLFFCAAIACNPVQKNKNETISVSILPQKYFTERIAGDKFNIQVITPPGASPEIYEPTPGQLKALNESVLFFTNGYLLFEEHLIEKSGETLSSKIINLSKDIDLIADDVVNHGDHQHLHGVDPHYWLAPNEVRIQLKTILEAIVAIDPANEDFYRSNYNDFLAELAVLDEHIKRLLTKSKTSTFLIYHPAFAYFAREYNLEQVALETDGKEPTGTHIKNIIDIAKRERITTVLVQSQFNMAAAEVVAKEIGGRVELIDPLPENWLENMYALAQIFQNALNPQ